jgi:error-prone DNA polymerase
MLAKGYPNEFAERLFEQIRGFGEYGFPESHAASFAKLVYVSSWLKHYYPAAFTAALINSQPMGFYAPAQLVHDAQSHGVEVLPIDVNHSDWDCTLEGPKPSLRLGMRLVRGLAESAAHAIEQARTTEFRSVAELSRRAGLGRGVIKRLADADAFGSLKLDRRAALWQALDQESAADKLPLFSALEVEDEAAPPLPCITKQEQVYADYHAVKLTLRDHPISFLREELDAARVTPAGDLVRQSHGKGVKAAGIVLMRQRPGTAKGITFVTLEDETGIANLIVHPATWMKYELAARQAKALLVSGRLERQGQVVHIVARKLEDLDWRLKELHCSSRDFH